MRILYCFYDKEKKWKEIEAAIVVVYDLLVVYS